MQAGRKLGQSALCATVRSSPELETKQQQTPTKSKRQVHQHCALSLLAAEQVTGCILMPTLQSGVPVLNPGDCDAG